MRETEGSMRAWFIAMGILGILGGMSAMNDYQAELGSLPEPVVRLGHLASVGCMVLGVFYLITAGNFREDLPEGALLAHRLLVITLGLEIAVLVGMNTLLADRPGPGQLAVIGTIIAMTGYVRSQLRRLTAEAADRAKPVAAVARAVAAPSNIGSWAVRSESRS